ncbi:MAG: hypothetical protein WCD12_20850 [Candidatus Binatus sp.]|uniref:hypothetical protein n=1 Tax=Candidatus Binatus sp. TaxID=2811406 RepID=UPI003C792C3B
MTRFAACFILVFGELAWGGIFALAIPPFFNVERGFYKSSAAVYLAASITTAIGLGLLALRGGASAGPGAASLWTASALWTLSSIAVAVYLYTLWTENGLLRSRAYALGLAVGLIALIANVTLLMPPGFGAVAAVAYALTAITSALVLGLVSGAMLFGHWYLIDLDMPVDYLRTYIRILGIVLVADLIALGLAIGLPAILGSAGAAAAVNDLFASHLGLLAVRLILGPVATIVLVWMCWQTLKIPQTMAATGLLYIAVMSVLVGEMLGRFILFRTAIPL